MRVQFESDLFKVQEDLDFMTKSVEDLQLEMNERDVQEIEEEPDELADILGELREASGLHPRSRSPPLSVPKDAATPSDSVPRVAKTRANATNYNDNPMLGSFEDFDPETNTMFIRKTTEFEKIVIPQFPGSNQLLNYRTELAAALATASGRYD